VCVHCCAVNDRDQANATCNGNAASRDGSQQWRLWLCELTAAAARRRRRGRRAAPPHSGRLLNPKPDQDRSSGAAQTTYDDDRGC
jgi:hypothetical protein